MSAYVISEVDVRDAAGFETYRSIAAKAIAQYGGRYLVRGGAAEAAEGGPPPKTLIVVEFPSMERLREWYASPEYAEALKHRRTALDRRLIFVEGVALISECRVGKATACPPSRRQIKIDGGHGAARPLPTPRIHHPSSTILPRDFPLSKSACARLRLAALMVPKLWSSVVRSTPLSRRSATSFKR